MTYTTLTFVIRVFVPCSRRALSNVLFSMIAAVSTVFLNAPVRDVRPEDSLLMQHMEADIGTSFE